MFELFLQAAPNLEIENMLPGIIGGGIIAFILSFILLFLIIGIGLYIYTSLAFMKIGEKARIEEKWLAWIPIVGKPLLTSKIAKMHWWPILLLIGFWIPILGWALMIAFAVFCFIWMWKTFEAVGKPGWWILLSLIPIAGGIIYLILVGIAAWGGESSVKKRK